MSGVWKNKIMIVTKKMTRCTVNSLKITLDRIVDKPKDYSVQTDIVKTRHESCNNRNRRMWLGCALDLMTGFFSVRELPGYVFVWHDVFCIIATTGVSPEIKFAKVWNIPKASHEFLQSISISFVDTVMKGKTKLTTDLIKHKNCISWTSVFIYLGALLLAWINFNPGMDK